MDIKYVPEKNIAYINNPKVGCSTIKRSLLGQDVGNVHLASHFNKLDNPFVPLFTIVRNPYTRIVSGYLNKIGPDRDDAYTWGRFYKKYGLSENSIPTFDEFINIICNSAEEDLDPHFRPQYLNIMFDSIKPERIFFLEKMEEVEKYLSKKGIELVTRDGHKTDSKNKSKLLLTSELKDKIYKAFHCDFDYFGYSKDGTIEPQENLLEYVQSVPKEFLAIDSESIKKKGELLDVNVLRESSLLVEEFNINYAIYLMNIAKNLRPNGPVINKELNRMLDKRNNSLIDKE